MPKVSIIIPVYNVEKYLRECLDSVLCQTLREIEILCINDASTDESLAILREYEKRDSRMIVIDQPKNRGQAAARNIGLRKSNGEYIYFLDADDMLSECEALELLYCKAAQGRADGVLFDSQVFYETEQLRKSADDLRCISYSSLPGGTYSGKEYFCRSVEDQTFTCVIWKQFWKRSYLMKNKLWFQEDTSPIEDTLFSFQAVLSADILIYFPRFLHIYRVRGNSSMTVPFSKKRFLASCRCLFSILRFIERRTVDLREAEALYRYFADIRTFVNDNVIKLIQNGEDLNQAEMTTGWDALYLRMLLLADYPRLGRLFTPDEYQEMQKSKAVVVYGAGKAGQDVKLLLDRFGIHNYQVAVTKKQPGAPADLHEIAEFAPYGQSCFVIVAVTRKYRGEMEETLDSLGLKTHISLES